MGKSSSIETTRLIGTSTKTTVGRRRNNTRPDHARRRGREGGEEAETLFASDGCTASVSQSVSHADLFRLTPSLLFPSPPSYFPPLSLKQAGPAVAGWWRGTRRARADGQRGCCRRRRRRRHRWRRSSDALVTSV